MARPRTDIRLRVLHTARERFLRDGVDGASLRSIARDARTSVGMIHYYFPTKDDLFLGVVEEVYEGLLRDLGETLASEGGFEARVRRLLARFGAMTDDEAKVVRMVLREILGRPKQRRVDRLLARFTSGHIPLMLGMIAEGVAAGEVREGAHPVVLGMSIFTLGTMPHVLLGLIPPDFPPAHDAPRGNALAQRLADVAIGGVGRMKA